jgi:hypothetical protein
MNNEGALTGAPFLCSMDRGTSIRGTRWIALAALLATVAVHGQARETYLYADSLHDLRFVVSTHLGMTGAVHCQVDEVTVTAKGERIPFLELPLAHAQCPCPDAEGRFSAVELFDVDFDGFRDLRIQRPENGRHGPEHRYWRWDPAARTFSPSPELDSIQQPQFDPARRMVSSQWYAEAGHRGGSNFRYENGRLVMVSNMEKFTEGDHERWVIWGQKDGRLQPVEERRVPLDRH